MQPLRHTLKHVGRGALMGLSDLVPGISGGTIALLLGIHPRLVGAISGFDVRLPRDLVRSVRGDREARSHLARLDLWFLVPLAVGIGGAILAGSRGVTWLIEDHPVGTMAFFLGLLAAGVRVPWNRITVRPGIKEWSGLALGIAAAVGIGLVPAATWEATPWFLAFAGFIALAVMLLPGVSGSSMMVLLGLYGPIVAAVADLDVLTLLPFLAGGVLGLAVCARALRYLLSVHEGATLATLTGLLAGSMVRVWPWRTGTGFAEGVPALPVAEGLVAVLGLVAAGAVLVRIIEHLGAPETNQ